MKQILKRLFNHEILTREEACTLLLNITNGCYNETQIAALLTVFQMRGIKVDELTGFRDALLSTRIPVDLSDFHPIDIVGTGGDGKNIPAELMSTGQISSRLSHPVKIQLMRVMITAASREHIRLFPCVNIVFIRFPDRAPAGMKTILFKLCVQNTDIRRKS